MRACIICSRKRIAAPTIAHPSSIASQIGIFFSVSERERMIGGRVSSDAAVLSTLHAFYPWIPSDKQTRPTDSTRAAKERFLSGKPLVQLEDELISEHALRPGESALVLCPFPYATEGVHYILWMMADDLPSEATITNCIRAHTSALGVREFVWYENPKKSVVSSRLHHVHVFAPIST